MNLKKKLKNYTKKTIAIKKGFGKKLKNTEAISLLATMNFSKFKFLIEFKRYSQKYELFKLAEKVPGDIECGVHKGSGIYLYAKFLKLFKPHTLTK